MPQSPFAINPEPYGQANSHLPWKLAAPSFVRPAGIAENCDFLAEHFDEVGLCLFETEACLAYDETELPPRLTELPLSYHAHLPLDLDWSAPDHAWRAIAGLVEKISFLNPTAYVLHPSPATNPTEIAKRFGEMGVAPSQVLVENIENNPLSDIWPEIVASGLSLCLDTGHILAYSQQPLLEQDGLWDRVRMAHLNAPDPLRPSRHVGLPLLDRKGRQLLQEVLVNLNDGATVMLELFDEPSLMTSLNFFEAAATQVKG